MREMGGLTFPRDEGSGRGLKGKQEVKSKVEEEKKEEEKEEEEEQNW